MTGSDATMNLDTTPETHVQEITVSEPVTKSNLGALAAYKITPLEDDNWLAWKETIEDIFRVHKVIDHIEGTAKRPDGNDINALQVWEDAEDKAHMLLKINLKPSNVPHVTRARTTNVHEAWENLRTIHEMRTQVSTFINERNFLNMRMAEGDDVMHHITEMRKLQSQLLLMGSDIPESKFKFALVTSLPKSWRTWVQSYLGSMLEHGFPERSAQSGTQAPRSERETPTLRTENGRGLASAHALHPLYGMPLYFRGRRTE